jgi:hypothetical protein
MANYQSVVPAKMGQALISGGTTLLYTCPASSIAMLKDFDVANQGSTTVSVTVWAVPSGGSVGPAYVIVPAIPLPANSILQWTGTQVMNAGDTIQAVAAGGGLVSMKCSGGVAT